MTLATKVLEVVKVADFLSSGDETGALMRAHDWSASPLGTPDTWPQSLRSVVGLLLGSKFPMFVAWGEELGFLYNDAYAEILDAKHPGALGRRFQDIWSEIWPDISPLIEAALAGQATYREDLPLVIRRKGFDEQAWFTFSYSPVRDESGQVAGMYCAVAETTHKVLVERRQAFLLGLGERLRNAAEPRAAMDAAVEALGRHLGASRVGYSEVQNDGETIVCATCFADGVEPILGTFRLDDFGPDSIARQRRGAIEVCDDVAADPAQVHATWAAIETRAFVSMPLVRDGRFTASLYVNLRDPHRWSRDEVTLVEEVAARTWDAVERARAEARSRETEARFRLMADAVPQIVWVTDAEGRNEFFNKQWFDYTGAEPHPTSAAQVATDFIHPDDAASTMAAFDAARRTGGTYLVEHRIRSKTGDYRWFLVRGEAYRDPGTGELTRWFGASTDIHDRKLAEESLQESEERFRLMADSSPALIWVSDENAKVVFANKRYEEVFGHPSSEMHDEGWRQIVHRDDLEEHFADFLKALNTRGRFKRVTRVIDREGHLRWLHCEGVPRYRSDGAFAGYVGVNLDITDAKRAEQALRDMNDTLEQRVAERTSELEATQEALRQSQKLEAMGQLTGGVAHDFNNLLTPIIGSLDMLMRRGFGSERERRLIDGALQSAERAKTLVQRLLAFARRQPLQPSAVDVKRLVGGMADLIASTSGPKVDVRVDLPGDLPAAKADANQVEMAILNLAVNARDAMPDGGVLTISAARESVAPRHRAKLRPGPYVRISVADTGIGMDNATLARAIEPFFSTKGIGKGTGLGLSMAHGLASQLDGTLAITSSPGEGTTVDLWLPVSPMAADDDSQVPSAVQRPNGRGTALLVDDEELVRMSTADMLMDLGYEVVEAGSAEEALRLVQEGLHADVLVTDHLMPGMSGADLVRELRSRRPELPVLVVSGYAEEEAIGSSIPRLTKPFRNAELAASLADLVPANPR